MDVYQDIFENWSDVQREFDTDAAEPYKVLFARYSYEDYSGDADVAWQNEDGSIGYVSGGHCSCYGLEGQWDPEIYSVETARGMIERSKWAFGDARSAVEAVVAQ